MTAIYHFKRDHKRWPGSLEELSPLYLKTNPADTGFHYDVYKNQWLLSYPAGGIKSSMGYSHGFDSYTGWSYWTDDGEPPIRFKGP